MFAFIPIAIIAFVIIGVIVSAAKQGAETKKKKDAEKAMSLLDNKEEFKKFLEYDSSESERRPQQRPQQSSKVEPQRLVQPQPTAYRSPQPAKQQMTAQLQQRLVELQRRQQERVAGASKNIVTSSHHDSHCDVSSHKDNHDKYRVEYVPTMNSIGGKSTEGCQDHYNVRYVKLDEENDNELELTALQKAIVYGEVINQPAFKRQYGSRRLR